MNLLTISFLPLYIFTDLAPHFYILIWKSLSHVKVVVEVIIDCARKVCVCMQVFNFDRVIHILTVTYMLLFKLYCIIFVKPNNFDFE